MMGLVMRDELSGPLLTKTAYDHGLLLIYANNDPRVCQLLPPLIMTEEQVDRVVNRLDGALASARKLKPLLGVKNRMENMWRRVNSSR